MLSVRYGGGIAGLGADPTPADKTTGEKKADVKAKSASEGISEAGGSGDWLSDALKIITSIFGGIGSGAKKRAPRIAAQDRLDKQKQLSLALVEDTAQYGGKRLTEQLFGTLVQEVLYIHGNTQLAANQYWAGGTYGT